jgi:DNA-binding response OmpR family regulator
VNSLIEESRKQCVLVIDDQPKILRFIEINLKLHGFSVITTTSGEKALKLVESEKPDLILLDIVMPDSDGFNVLKKLRVYTQLPVIVFSASPANFNRAILLGANDCIPKPIKLKEMVNKINKFLATS